MTSTSTDMARLRRTLRRLEEQGLSDGYKAEIIGGGIVMRPIRPHHGHTVQALRNALKAQLPTERCLVSNVAFVFGDDETERCPDLAVIPRLEADRNLASYACGLMDAAIDVVPSPGGLDHDHRWKARDYARLAIPAYLVFDPYAAHCVAMWDPAGEHYTRRATTPYGSPVRVPTPAGDWTIDTAPLPVDPADPTARALPPPGAPAP